MCASVADLYGPDFGLTQEQLIKRTLQNNQKCADDNTKYQNFIKQGEIQGTANFKNESMNQINVSPNIPPEFKNDSNFVKRLSLTDSKNNWPSNQKNSVYNRFQGITDGLFGIRENFKENLSHNEKECLQQLVLLVKELLIMIKIIMFVLILLFVIKILERK